jgi:ADP-ribosylglycohydrolase
MAAEGKAVALLGKVQGAIISCFAADALGLGWHWIYTPADIKRPINRLMDPQAKWHPNEKAGDLTTYGDQMLVLLQSVKEKSAFDVNDFSKRWQKLFSEDYKGYVDKATKDTLANLAKGAKPEAAGSESSDFAPAGRWAPLLLAYRDEKTLVENAVLQAKMTHTNALVLSSVEFLAKVTLDVLNGSTPTAAIKERVKTAENKELVTLVNAGLASKDKDTTVAVKEFGPACGVGGCLPSVIHCITKYEDNLAKAVEENIAAGGESCTRAMAIATVLGAYHSSGGAPIVLDYAKEMKAFNTISGLVGYTSPAAPAAPAAPSAPAAASAPASASPAVSSPASFPVSSLFDE